LLLLSLGVMRWVGDASAETESDQVVPRLNSISKYVSPTSRKTAISLDFTGGNTIGIRAVLDSCCGLSRVDTAGYGFMLRNDETARVWAAPAEKLSPVATDGRAAFSLYFTSGSPAVADTFIAKQVILDQARPPLGSVDQYAIIDQEVKPTALDSTATFSLATLRTDKVYLTQPSGSNAAIRLAEGTASSSGKAIELTGTAGSTQGTGLSLSGWGGVGISLTRASGVTSPAANGVNLDMTAEADTGSIQYGQEINWGGTGKVYGAHLYRATGTRKFTSSALKVETASPAAVSSGATEYGIYVDQSATANGTSKNVAVYAHGDTANGGRSLQVVGDSEFGTGSTSDTLLVKQPATFSKAVAMANGTLAPAAIGQAGASSNQVLKWNGTIWAPAVDATAAGGGHGLRDDGTDKTARSYMNFVGTATIATTLNDDSGSDETEIQLDVPTGGIGTTQIATDGVDAAEIAANAVGSSEIAADAVGSSEIAADAVGSSEIATDGVGNAELADNSVDRGELVDDAAGASEIDWGEVVDGIRKRPFYWWDFIDAGTTMSNIDPWQRTAIASGTCAAVAGTMHHPGQLSLSSSVSASSGVVLNLGTNVTSILISGGECFEATFFLTNTTNVTSYIGFIDGTTTESVDGVYASIVGTTLTGKSSSNSSRTSTGTTYTVSTATWYRLRIKVNSDASGATFYLYNDSGSELWTNTVAATMPTATGRETGSGLVSFYSTGGAQVLTTVDWMAMWLDGRRLTR